jgi:hypothetical protein
MNFGGSGAEMKEFAIAFGLARRTPLYRGKKTRPSKRDFQNSVGNSFISAISFSGS